MISISHERYFTDVAHVAYFVVLLHIQDNNHYTRSEIEDFINVCRQQVTLSSKYNEAFFISCFITDHKMIPIKPKECPTDVIQHNNFPKTIIWLYHYVVAASPVTTMWLCIVKYG